MITIVEAAYRPLAPAKYRFPLTALSIHLESTTLMCFCFTIISPLEGLALLIVMGVVLIGIDRVLGRVTGRGGGSSYTS